MRYPQKPKGIVYHSRHNPRKLNYALFGDATCNDQLKADHKISLLEHPELLKTLYAYRVGMITWPAGFRHRTGSALTDQRRIKQLIRVPTILRLGPYRFLFYSVAGEEPSHVHVEQERNGAKFWIKPVCWLMSQYGG
jgi:hypothetical protein